MTRITQVGLCVAQLPRAVRRYIEAFGFQDAGGRILWGARLAAIQELGADMSGSMWWLVGSQEFFQLELFRHDDPAQRPLPEGWLPNMLGWVRWGLAVNDFDGAIRWLERASTHLSEIVIVDGLRRVCFRDPDAGVVVEVMEDGAALAGFRPTPSTAPRMVYVTLSVPDLDRARTFYHEALGMTPVEAQLHPRRMEDLWGLSGAEPKIELLDGESMLLEIVEYPNSPGRPRPDARLSDQGIMNIAIGYRERADLERALESVAAGGAVITAPLANQPVGATYIRDPQGNSVEMLFLPQEFEEQLGWVARTPLFR